MSSGTCVCSSSHSIYLTVLVRSYVSFMYFVYLTMYGLVFYLVLYSFSRYKLLTFLSQFILLVCSVDVWCSAYLQHSYSSYVFLCIFVYCYSLLTSVLSNFSHCLLLTYFTFHMFYYIITLDSLI